MMTTIKPAHRIFTIATLTFALAACEAKDSSDTASGADGGTADGGTADGTADGGTADGTADGGTADGTADGGSADGTADGGSADGTADGSADGSADGGADDGATDGGTTTGGDAVRGEGLYSACSGCHGADGDSGYAPDLSVRVPSMTEAAIIGIVQTGRGGMPAIYTDATDAADVTAYLIATWGG